MDILTAIELIEDTDGTVAECYIIEAWQYLVDTGAAWQLQGSYGRAAQHMIECGVLTAPTQH